MISLWIPKISWKSFGISSKSQLRVKTKIGCLIRSTERERHCQVKQTRWDIGEEMDTNMYERRKISRCWPLLGNCNFAKQLDCWDFQVWNLADGRKTFHLIQLLGIWPDESLRRRDLSYGRGLAVLPNCSTRRQVSKSYLCTSSWICETFQRDCQVMGTT